MKRFRSDSGAAAVEFALVVPILITLVLGIIEFGRGYNVQNAVSAAAREGVRVMAIKKDASAARTAAQGAGVFSPAITDAEICIRISGAQGCSATTCPSGSTVTLTISYPLEYMTGLFPGKPTLTGTGVMRCGG
ncbi:TadE/TadG family type IV pilus assembly protein [Rhodococcus sp. ACT016]|uniref:TadE/TadG family type IV pilus assembly protein n=1 Tax=Rhodococcus sp. ACT016 TaxID=3134808 RepID=UPI003D299462